MPRRLLILGSTGSIGTQALEIVERSGEFELVGLSAGRAWEQLVEQARERGGRRRSVRSPRRWAARVRARRRAGRKAGSRARLRRCAPSRILR
ncbi:MAG: hypothetical protein ACYCSI_16725 [Solirubrobacteraceae bacterium]